MTVDCSQLALMSLAAQVEINFIFQATSGVGGKKAAKANSKAQQPAFQHPWLLTSLKGHSGRVLDMSLSENGKMLATCADDRSILIWFTKDFAAKEHKSIRANVQFDHATRIKWSPDSKAFLIHCATSNQLQVHKVYSFLWSHLSAFIMTLTS